MGQTFIVGNRDDPGSDVSMRSVPGNVRSPFVTSFGFLTFLTDYGLEDGFVATCHGVAARIAPAARIHDITHLGQPGDVRRGAAVLAQTIPPLPPAVPA